MRRSTILAIRVLLVAAAWAIGSTGGAAQLERKTAAAESQAPNRSLRERTDDAGTTDRKTDAQILADLRQETAAFLRMVEEYEAKVFEIPTRENPQAQDQHLEELADRLEKKAVQITGEKDVRSAIERLVRCVDRTERQRSGVRHGGQQRWTAEQEVVAMTAIVCVSWKNTHGDLKEYVFRRDGGYPASAPRRRNLPPYIGASFPSWDGVVLAAIESYRDQRAAEFLMDYALRESEEDTLDSMGQWATYFLRGFDPELVIPRLEAARKKELESAQATRGSSPASPKHSFRHTYMQDCLRCLEYAQSLSPEDRRAYQYFERSYWWSYAFARRGMRSSLYAAPDWKKGNERFLLDLLKANVTQVPTIPRSIPNESAAWLFQQLDSSDLPMDVQQRLATWIPYSVWKERQREDELEEWRRKASNQR